MVVLLSCITQKQPTATDVARAMWSDVSACVFSNTQISYVKSAELTEMQTHVGQWNLVLDGYYIYVYCIYVGGMVAYGSLSPSVTL